MTGLHAAQNNTGVASGRIKMNQLLMKVLQGHVLVAASEPAFFQQEARLDMSLLTVWVRLTRRSIEYDYFQTQLADAVACWDSSYAARLKTSRQPSPPEQGMVVEPFWAHPPQERMLLVFDGIEHVPSGPVHDFLRGLVNHPLENMAVVLLTPSEMAGGVAMDPEDAGDLKKVAGWIARGELGELEAFFVWRGIQYTVPALTKEYLHLFRRIPEWALEASPVLQIILAGMFSITGEVEKAHYVLRRAGAALEAGALSAEKRWVLGEIYLLQSLLNTVLGVRDPLALLKDADRLLPGGSNLITRHSGVCLGNNSAMIYPGYEKQDLHRILEIMAEADPYMLRLTRGFGYGRQYLASAELCYYTDQFPKAISSAQRAISRAGEYEQWDLQCCAHGLLMRIACAQGDYRQAVQHIKSMKECRLRYGEKEQRILILPDLAEAEFYLAIGEGQRVAPWLLEETRAYSTESAVFAGSTPIIRANCLMERGKLLEALDAAEKALQQFSKHKQFVLSLQAYILKAVLYSRIGESDLAFMHLRHACEMGASNDLVMMFAEYGRHMAALMAQAREDAGRHDIPLAWIDRVQQRAETYSRRLGHLRSSYLCMETGDVLLARLTMREREALELLSEGLSNQQIAERMGIKVTSLKTALQRIYAKIDAGSRTEAMRIWLAAKE